MDNNYINSMEQALSLSPDNFILRITLIQALYEHQQLSTALSLLKEVESCQVEQELHQILAAKIFIESGDGENALLFLSSNLPEVKILKAKAYQILNEFSLAREFYVEAVKENSSLEDIDFARELRVAKDALDNSKRIKLTVVANDDTDAVEVTRLIKPREEVISFSEVGGLADVKKQIRKKLSFLFKNPRFFKDLKRK
ncbi:tetratricopeptide repeat protein [Shewanella woodyi]|uniref:tetratricopeptide repeat protein n=1 Tax=Shewanella woodyi TaxID=60961 RepID=UPI0037496510